MNYRRYYGRPEPNDDGLVSFLVGCLAGIVIGGALGILMAPHRGDISRRKIVRRAGETRDQVMEAVEDRLESFKEKKEAQNGDEEAHN